MHALLGGGTGFVVSPPLLLLYYELRKNCELWHKKVTNVDFTPINGYIHHEYVTRDDEKNDK